MIFQKRKHPFLTALLTGVCTYLTAFWWWYVYFNLVEPTPQPLYTAHWYAVPEGLVIYLMFYLALLGIQVQYTYPPDMPNMLKNAVRQVMTERGYYAVEQEPIEDDYQELDAQDRPVKANHKGNGKALYQNDRNYLAVVIKNEDEPGEGEFMDIDTALWTMAQQIEERGWLLSERTWSDIFGRAQLNEITDRLEQRGYIEKKNRAANSGYRFRAKGKAVMRGLRERIAPFPTRWR